jgi:predicted ATPase/class 3 adenylate cyclase
VRCPKCQFENRDEAKFCGECGHEFKVTCPECGTPNRAEYKFCDTCGFNLRTSPEVLAVEYSKPQSYTPKFLADKILTTRSSIEGERKRVTVLFADVANFTAMAEKFDPEEVHQIMDGCFKILMDEIHKYEGTINQFTGDGLMALFGAPVAHENHAQRACYAALFIQKAIAQFSEQVKMAHGVEFKMRIGLNSGPVIVGSIGDDLRMDYTAVGDTTNLASRMESMAMPGNILVARETFKLARDFFEFQSLGKVEPQGKEKPIEAYRLIKAGEVETRIEASLAKGLTRFVGRKNSMAAFREALEAAKAGTGQVVAIVGEAGVGKSRILLEFKNSLPLNQYAYLEGRCLHFGVPISYLPFLNILRSYFSIKVGEPEFIIKRKMADTIRGLDEKLENALPPLMDLLSLKVEDEDFSRLEPQQKREKAFEAIRNLLIRISQEKHLVLAIEDLHWIDKTSEEFLNYLIRSLASTNILLVLLYRPDYIHQWGSKSYYRRIGLNQLTVKSSAELVQAILQGGEVSPEVEELILNRASGNALYMEELTHSLLENGFIRKKNHQFVLSGKVSDIHIPDAIQGIIAARMDRLEDHLKRTLQVASVIGRDFAFVILQTITGLREELKGYLLNLQGLEFIYEKSLFPDLEYIFKHALTQEVAYNSLLLKKRIKIHAKTGKAIEQIYAQRLEEFYEMLAYHYSKSENLQKAAHYLKLSGLKAIAKHSPAEALHYYQEALKVLKQLPASVENKKTQIEVCLLSFIPSVNLGYPEDCLPLIQEAEKLTKEIDDQRNLAHAITMISSFHIFRGDSLQGTNYAEKGFELAQRTQDISVIAPSALELCIAYYGQGLYFKVIEIAPDVLHLLEEKEIYFDIFYRAIAIYPALCTFYGHALGALGNFEKGAEFCQKGLRTAAQSGDLKTLAYCEMYSGFFYDIKGDGKLVIEHLNNCINFCEETKWHLVKGYAFAGLGCGYCLQNDPANARTNIEKGIQIIEDYRLRFRLPRFYWALCLALFDLGDLEKALAAIEQALMFARKYNEKNFEGLSLIWLGKILEKTDPNQYDTAEESILKGIDMLQELRLKPYVSQGYLYLGELYIDTGQKAKALEKLKKAEKMFREMGMDYWLARTQKVLARL